MWTIKNETPFIKMAKDSNPEMMEYVLLKAQYQPTDTELNQLSEKKRIEVTNMVLNRDLNNNLSNKEEKKTKN